MPRPPGAGATARPRLGAAGALSASQCTAPVLMPAANRKRRVPRRPPTSSLAHQARPPPSLPGTCSPVLAGFIADSSSPSSRPSRATNSACSTSRLRMLSAVGRGNVPCWWQGACGCQQEPARKRGGRLSRCSGPGPVHTGCHAWLSQGAVAVPPGRGAAKPAVPAAPRTPAPPSPRTHAAAGGCRHAPGVTAGGRSCVAARRARTAGVCVDAVSSLATFWNSTRLSPSAVMPAGTSKQAVRQERLTEGKITGCQAPSRHAPWPPSRPHAAVQARGLPAGAPPHPRARSPGWPQTCCTTGSPARRSARGTPWSPPRRSTRTAA